MAPPAGRCAAVVIALRFKITPQAKQTDEVTLWCTPRGMRKVRFRFSAVRAKSWVASTWFVLGDAIVRSSHARLTCSVSVRARVMKESAQVSLLCRYLLLELQKTVSHGHESVGGCSNETETEITEMRYPETLKLPRASLQCIPMTLVA